MKHILEKTNQNFLERLKFCLSSALMFRRQNRDSREGKKEKKKQVEKKKL